MAVTKIALTQWEGSEGVDAIEYNLTYLVWTNSRSDGPLTVRQAMGITYGDTYASGSEFDILARCSHISERQLTNAHFNHWEVQVTYTQNESEPNPLNEPIKESVTWDSVQRKTNRWGNGDPILNTAFDPIIGGLDYEDNTPTVTYTLNQSIFPFVLAQAVRNAVNSTPWKGFAARTVKIASMTSERMFDKRIGVYYAVSYTFAINPDTFNSFIDSTGFNEILPIPGGRKKKFPIWDGLALIKEPVALRPDGKKIEVDPATAIPIPVSTDPNNYMAIINGIVYPTVNFNTLFPFLSEGIT